MYISANMDVQNWVHRFESLCILLHVKQSWARKKDGSDGQEIPKFYRSRKLKNMGIET